MPQPAYRAGVAHWSIEIENCEAVPSGVASIHEHRAGASRHRAGGDRLPRLQPWESMSGVLAQLPEVSDQSGKTCSPSHRRSASRCFRPETPAPKSRRRGGFTSRPGPTRSGLPPRRARSRSLIPKGKSRAPLCVPPSPRGSSFEGTGLTRGHPCLPALGLKPSALGDVAGPPQRPERSPAKPFSSNTGSNSTNATSGASPTRSLLTPSAPPAGSGTRPGPSPSSGKRSLPRGSDRPRPRSPLRRRLGYSG